MPGFLGQGGGMVNREGLRIFTGSGNRELALDICAELGMPLGAAYVGRFPDGEVDVKVECDVRGGDIFIVQPTCPPANENLMELLILIDCVKRASANRVTAVIPYFGYARKDRKDEGRVPITAKLVANLITKAGADRVLTVDLHAAQIQGFFDIPVDHLYARTVLLPVVRRMNLKDPVVVAPDVGASKLTRAWAKAINAGMAIVDKRRISGDQTEVENMVGDVEGHDVLVVDDLVATGGSLSDAARVAKERGAGRVVLAVTHAVMVGKGKERLQDSCAEKVLITDTIPHDRAGLPSKFEVVSVGPLLARAIERIHRSESVSYLFQTEI